MAQSSDNAAPLSVLTHDAADYNKVMTRFCHLLLLAVALVFLAATTCADDRASETQVFGVTASGNRFVYVFDRSLSMQGAPLAAAKRELVASISKLKEIQQFQIIFYNEKPRVMPSPQLLFADENGRAQAESFISSITAAGGTDHLQALKLALRLQPDVIFFLTDADEPPLTENQLNDIRRNNGAAAIHVIEFKSGADSGKRNFLRQLAEDNRGQYKHIDTSSLPGTK
jgi:von Willebrand factor type A domain